MDITAGVETEAQSSLEHIEHLPFIQTSTGFRFPKKYGDSVAKVYESVPASDMATPGYRRLLYSLIDEPKVTLPSDLRKALEEDPLGTTFFHCEFCGDHLQSCNHTLAVWKGKDTSVKNTTDNNVFEEEVLLAENPELTTVNDNKENLKTRLTQVELEIQHELKKWNPIFAILKKEISDNFGREILLARTPSPTNRLAAIGNVNCWVIVPKGVSQDKIAQFIQKFGQDHACLITPTLITERDLSGLEEVEYGAGEWFSKEDEANSIEMIDSSDLTRTGTLIPDDLEIEVDGEILRAKDLRTLTQIDIGFVRHLIETHNASHPKKTTNLENLKDVGDKPDQEHLDKLIEQYHDVVKNLPLQERKRLAHDRKKVLDEFLFILRQTQPVTAEALTGSMTRPSRLRPDSDIDVNILVPDGNNNRSLELKLKYLNWRFSQMHDVYIESVVDTPQEIKQMSQEVQKGYEDLYKTKL